MYLRYIFDQKLIFPFFLLCSNKSGTIEESLSVTNEDINLRKQEINHLNQKHKQEVEDLRSSLTYSQMNQSRVLDSLWAKVIMK